MRLSPARRTGAVKALLVAISLFGLPVITSGARSVLHATLLRSTPAAKSTISASPSVIRLVFSEQVVPELSQISLTASGRSSISLKVSNDPHDVHTLIGPVESPLAAGTYKVVWRVLSADGHPVAGNFDFTLVGGGASPVAASSTTSPALPGLVHGADSMPSHAGMTMSSPDEKPVPIVASLLRGLGLGALMAGVGLLFFGLTSREHANLAARPVASRAITAGGALLAVHAVLWMDHVAPGGNLTGTFVGSLLSSTVGRIELTRTVLALLTAGSIALAGHRKLALGLGTACLVVSGAIGHPAAIDPYWAIPAKVLHLLAGAIWLGGLIWLVWLAWCDDAACRVEARRVSSVALVSVGVIAASGILQAFLFLNTPGDLIHSAYGKLVLAKVAGLALLIGFGAYNRFGLLPTIDLPEGPRKLATSVRQEIVLVTAVIVIGGFLAYVPTPSLSTSTATVTGNLK